MPKVNDRLSAKDGSRLARARLTRTREAASRLWRRDAKEFVRGNAQHARQMPKELRERVVLSALVVGDHALRDADRLGELDLGQAGGAAEFREPRPEALERLRAGPAHASASGQGAPILTRRARR